MIKNMIAGSKGGSSKPHTPVEMEDNLISINRIRILLAVSDGEVDPDFSLKDLYFDDVPVMNQDGSLNFQNVKAEFRPGTQTQDYIQGFTDTASEITVARDLTAATPYIISVTNKNLSAIRIKILMPRGFTQEDNGDLTGVRVEYAVDMAVDGAEYKEVMHDVIEGKTMSGYDRSRRIDLPAFNERVLLRVRRLTDSTSARVTDLIKMQSYAEVVDAKFRYPLTGLVYVEFDSELFPNALPNISIKKKWKIINVPSNYDPISRTYSGSWDGTWKKSWSNNPAFVLYDLITNQRYGLDQRELGIALDKWSIYECAQYCDQMVPDGKGGTEPRYLCDVVIQSQVEAYQLVRDICSIFRGMSFWNGESLSIVIDKPRDPSYIFTNDNVVNGDFNYTFASEKSMYTQCNVTFDDEQNMYQQDVEGVFETESALRFGYNSTSITAIGCTRRSEANRRGRWILKTNVKSKTVNFATGLEGMIPTVGDVIVVSDNFESSALMLNLSGRLMEVNGLQVFTPFKIDARAGDRILVNKPDGKPVGRTISKVSDDGKTIELNVGFGFDVKPDSVFAIERTDIAQQRYVVTGITKGDGDEEFTYSITAVEYDANKYDEIDYGVNIDDRPTSVVQPDILPSPKNVKIESYSRVIQGASVETMHVSWDKVDYASLYEMQWRKDNGNWNNTPRTANKETEVEGIYAGNYHVRVRSVAANGSASGWSAIVSAGLTGKVGDPEKPINLTASDNEVFGIRVKWGMPEGSGDTAYIELHQAPNGADGHPLVDEATLLTLVPFPQYEYWHSILPAGHVVWYKARAVDKIGNVSDWTDFVRGMSSTDVSDITGDILDDILSSDGMKELMENAVDSSNKIKDQATSIIENALANDSDVRIMRKENGKRKAEIKQTTVLIANETEARVGQINELKVEFDENLKAGITQVNQAISNESEARANADTALNTRIGENESALTQKLDSWANVSGVGAQYSMKLGLTYNGQHYGAGMVMQLSNSPQGVVSQILFDANRFAIMSHQGGSYALPFVVENNQVLINSLLVKNGSIGNAQIADQINSNNWSSGNYGWMINKGGYAEFNNVTVRGTVHASDGNFKGTVEATRFIGDVVNGHVFNDSENVTRDNGDGSMPGTGSQRMGTYTFNDSGNAGSRTVILDTLISLSSPEEAGSYIDVTLTINGSSKIHRLSTGGRHFLRTSLGNVTHPVVQCSIDISWYIAAGKRRHLTYQSVTPYMQIVRGSGYFSE